MKSLRSGTTIEQPAADAQGLRPCFVVATSVRRSLASDRLGAKAPRSLSAPDRPARGRLLRDERGYSRKAQAAACRSIRTGERSSAPSGVPWFICFVGQLCVEDRSTRAERQ